jgi:hypothetical protein
MLAYFNTKYESLLKGTYKMVHFLLQTMKRKSKAFMLPYTTQTNNPNKSYTRKKNVNQ